jgi:hypothetical protein
MQTNTIKKEEFSRNADDLVKHTFNTFDFYTDSTDEPSDRLKAVAVTLRDDGYHIKDEPCVIIEIGKCVAVEHDTYNIDIWQTVNSYKSFEHSDRNYTVMTDGEADQAWDESLDSYLDECVLPDLPDTARNYFDDEKWKRDAKTDGRGHSLNHYDGSEEEANINGVDYYIYRRN